MGKVFNTKNTTQKNTTAKCNVLGTPFEALLSDQMFHVVTHPSDDRSCFPLAVNTLTFTLFIKIGYMLACYQCLIKDLPF